MPSFTLAEILARAEQLALAGADPHDSPVLDSGPTAEVILPHVWHYVTCRTVKDPQRQHLLRQTVNLTFANGVAPLPPEVLSEALPVAVLHNPADPTMRDLMSWIPYWFDFVRPLRSLLGYYTINESGEVAIRLPGQPWQDTGGFSGAIDLTIPCVPGLTDPVTVPDEIIDDVVAGVAGALRGEEPWKAIIAEVLT